MADEEEDFPMKDPSKAYLVYNGDTKLVIYEGNSLVKTIQAIYCGQPTWLVCSTPTHEVILKHAIYAQEHLN